MTLAGKASVSRRSPGDAYVVCLDCGEEFTYDWQKMKIGGRLSPRRSVPVEFASTHSGG